MADPPPPPAEFGPAPFIATEPVPTCAVCGGSSFQPFAAGYDYELRTCRNPWTFVRCDACGHVWLHPRPAVSTLSTIYPPTYYAYNYGQIPAVARHAKALLDRRKLAGIVRHVGRPVGAFVDVGCGDGRFLKAMHAMGVPRERCYGLELDASVVARLAADGYPVFCERIETSSNLPASGIDLATMFHVIEHVDEPGRVVDAIARRLAPGGIFAVETPNLDSDDARRFHATFWGGYHIPRHWHLFTPPTLHRLLRDHGLEPVATRYQTGHSFWMYSLHHRLQYGPTPWPRLSRWFDPVRNVAPLAAFTLWDTLRGMVGYKTSAMLVIARKSG